ncbi:MAG: YqeG family HAD IIIA-type phosphatase [Limnospira sp. PMC 1291.21]|uniref:YqeG family HAD IIIA-type phosphatase n=3 Tax=Limnospira TaxID=2596745 RepID=A0A9P1KJL7_9CYAN|nr:MULTISPECIES: YqeG family HAD IIIA-type phosphatase [Limnospira]AMW29806.1 hydrolase [Arthrospira platensis YZ]EKD08545.1 HAD superfamily phosphatase TIGR01668 [Arthrospira platensis C1]MBD2669486.1 YqeG family HAD IIIA-type phosphatase [Arthrospira platensis FACHB-439]MDC0837684.1 YqeG family HAD IIIA-type phosphatase [Limnoraphis robusta]MDY7054321.1 YqeG family HAD IIIA-type phosphatase [Limnospira fusiformis LS22]QJB24985.1 YqeG family HAD IIIA-type phosphatase [Limnospira fusiformis S
MSWGKLLEPDLVLGDSIMQLTPDILHQYDLKGLVLDVDETLVPITTQEVSDELREWVENVRPLFSLWLVSNNISNTRISGIANALGLPYINAAAKPSRRKLRQAVDAMDIPTGQIAMVGDRLFTDVLAGNRLGMFTILVEPMVDPMQTGISFSTRSIEVWISKLFGAVLKS